MPGSPSTLRPVGEPSRAGAASWPLADASFSATSTTWDTARSFTRFTQAIDEIVDVRVYL